MDDEPPKRGRDVTITDDRFQALTMILDLTAGICEARHGDSLADIFAKKQLSDAHLIVLAMVVEGITDEENYIVC